MSTQVSTVRAARFRGEGVVEVVERAVQPLGPGRVRLEVAYCGLCGSDRRLFAGGAGHIPGHEISGTVAQVGEGVEGIEIGQRALVYIVVFCGHCRPCRAGQTNRCLEATELVGWQLDGGYQEVVDVPARTLLPVPDDIDLATAVLALDTLGTAAHGLRMALAPLGGAPDRALVLGCGPLGLGVVAAARDLGIGGVQAADLVPARREAARRLGAVSMAVGDLEERSLPLVVEVTGTREGRQAAWSLVEPGGSLLLLGEGEAAWEVPATPRWRRTDMYVIRSFYFPIAEVEANWEMLRRTGPDLGRSVVSVHPLSELQTAFDQFVRGDVLKPLIEARR
ncbi:MAG TPA: alcohol dehydrogenase catalytic domain-containing protein [Candidatus Dormibacteraeota bacterium]|jgi:threonine dehydrogenase-like Zn-dependent dehydrogenase|nr:alcohol dehydrogenase catalytic domain-containing protein [Candidatus Dormibacteraeota bacterium]